MTAKLVPIARPLLGEEEVAAAARAIRSGWVTQGPEVAAFEREFAEYVGAPHAVAVSSCTTALHLALLVAGVQPGDEVVTVSHSFIATANAIRYCGAIPVFVDIDPATYNMNPSLVDAAFSDKTRVLLVVHQVGLPADLAPLLSIARARGIVVVEDAACAVGSDYDGAKIGAPHGDIACFSFHPRKLLTTGDGGMITTRNAEWDAQLRLLRQHGMSVPDTVRHASTQVIFESYPIVGFNYRMTDIQAAIGREQLRKLPAVVEERRALAATYASLLGDLAPDEPSYARTNWQSYVVRLPRGVDQKSVMQRMLDDGISTRRGVMCIHREASYAQGARIAGSLHESERAQDETIVIPLYGGMTADEQERVATSLERSVR